MNETTFIIALTRDGANRYRHRHFLDKNQIVEFGIQYEAYISGKWHVIVRYDTAHGFAHRDTLHPDGTETKIAFQHWDHAQVLTYGERDLKQNWKIYREQYERDLERLEKKRRNTP